MIISYSLLLLYSNSRCLWSRRHRVRNLETIFETKWGVFSNSTWCKSLVSCCPGSRMCWRGILLIRLLVIRLHIQECCKTDMQNKVFSSKQFYFCKRSVQQQSNGVDCGAFPAAFATDFLFGFSPEKRKYEESKLRSHLLMVWNKANLFHSHSQLRQQKNQNKV